MENKVIYCGSGKKQSETWIKGTINIAKIKDHIEEFKGHEFVKININIKEDLDQYGKDVSISIDKFKPEPKKENEQPKDKLNF
tara:strand:+ start:5631 stop:5879 length:249 start_codon:yes stop_codon:yes gene_type:complete